MHTGDLLPGMPQARRESSAELCKVLQTGQPSPTTLHNPPRSLRASQPVPVPGAVRIASVKLGEHGKSSPGAMAPPKLERLGPSAPFEALLLATVNKHGW